MCFRAFHLHPDENGGVASRNEHAHIKDGKRMESRSSS